MRHPAAPTIIAVLLGFLGLLWLWGTLRDDGHHEGNPHPDDVPKKEDVRRVYGAGGGENEDDAKREESAQ
ncbi:hypothetical protein BU26DRAFT_63358 [Trematosphaeria pertusa]|uniref:Secreted protein n=1 Tax=Trematosphaeria pertusa TaxID=390896 RepID=A0A6A6I738_9PLEO|nr:uncharacterized protein BU26DRAFT_63358 [Trematosphaeria pertusa]KAF2246147.1 hypothetical protein BU26DRAFT_63358 [Trematosphaeria pertusa]